MKMMTYPKLERNVVFLFYIVVAFVADDVEFLWEIVEAQEWFFHCCHWSALFDRSQFLPAHHSLKILDVQLNVLLRASQPKPKLHRTLLILQRHHNDRRPRPKRHLLSRLCHPHVNQPNLLDRLLLLVIWKFLHRLLYMELILFHLHSKNSQCNVV